MLQFECVGADGTQYAELAMMKERQNTAKKFHVSRQSNTVASKTTIYAEIDHTLKNNAIAEQKI